MDSGTSIRVVYVTDSAYKRLTEVSVASLLLYSTRPLDIVVYDTQDSGGLNESVASLAKSGGHRVEAVHLCTSLATEDGVALHSHISPATLAKAQAVELEAGLHSNILFLDGDVLACRSFDLDTVFGFSTTAAAVYDFVSYMPFDNQDLFGHRSRTGRSPDYFNAGVIAVNGRRWKAEQIAAKYVKCLQLHGQHCPFRHDEHGNYAGDCKGADQCALNMALEDDWTPLDFRWNVQKPLRHHFLWDHAFFRHYTGFRKFLAESNVNRDSRERHVLGEIRKETALLADTELKNDLGIMFLADRVKYVRQSWKYAATVRFLDERVKARSNSRTLIG